jgi:hypothetical protein
MQEKYDFNNNLMRIIFNYNIFMLLFVLIKYITDVK